MHSERELSHERMKLMLNIIHRTQTPLTLMHNQLEDIASNDLSEPISKKVERVLKHTNHVMECYQNVVALDRMGKEKQNEYSVIEFELFTYMTSVINQCRTYADERNVELKISKNFNYSNCRVNEAIMTAALQCLFTKMIDITPHKGRINIIVSHFNNCWSLRITNCPKLKSKEQRAFLPFLMMMSVGYWWSLRPVRKVIRLHGGKITEVKHGWATTLHIVVPVDSHCGIKKRKKEVNDVGKSNQVAQPDEESGTSEAAKVQKNHQPPHVLLVMADKELSGYLKETLSGFFRMSILAEPDRLSFFSGKQNPDAIIIDEFVNGVYGDQLCSEIKSDAGISSIPVILLINSNDYESYLTHSHSGADRLELRMVNVCRLKVDIQILIENYAIQRERIKKFLADNSSVADSPETVEKSDEDVRFMDKVQELLEKNLSKEGYTVDMLSSDIGVSRTGLYTRIKGMTGKAPIEYMLSYKMDKAKNLLATQQYTITEIATMLGYCDAKYFGKKFKEYYQVAPTKFIGKVVG